MNICNHIIDELQIIGIGPLMSETRQTYYANIKYWFMLHCKQLSIKIESPVFLPEEEADKKAMQEFTKQFNNARASVEELIQQLA